VPLGITVNGRAERVVQDAAYQELPNASITPSASKSDNFRRKLLE
jgi:hypothetical protein